MTDLYEIADIVDFLNKHKITAEQFLYCLLLHHDKRFARIKGTNQISRPLSQLYKYHTNVRKFKKQELEELIDKGLLVMSGRTFKPDHLDVTDKFVKEFLGQKYKFDQLLEVYPSFITNFDHPSKPMIKLKVFDNPEELAKRYNSFVKTDQMHQRVLELVEWGKETDNINISLKNFIGSKHWEVLIELREQTETVDHQQVI